MAGGKCMFFVFSGEQGQVKLPVAGNMVESLVNIEYLKHWIFLYFVNVKKQKFLNPLGIL